MKESGPISITPEKIKQLRRRIEYIIINNNLPLNRFISEIDTSFDFHRAAGKTYGLSLSKQEQAAIVAQYFTDIKILELVQLLLSIDQKNGMYLGKRYEIKGMDALIKILNAGEKSQPDSVVILKMDISHSSDLTQRYPKKISAIISDVKKAMEDICGCRNGTLLAWQGDGGFFLFNEEEGFRTTCNQAVLSGIHIMHWLWEYNLFDNRIDELVEMKVIIDTSYRSDLNDENVLSSKIYTKLNDLEKKYTDPGTILLSDFVFLQLNDKIRADLKSFYIGDYQYRSKYYIYSVKLQTCAEK